MGDAPWLPANPPIVWGKPVGWGRLWLFASLRRVCAICWGILRVACRLCFGGGWGFAWYRFDRCWILRLARGYGCAWRFVIIRPFFGGKRGVGKRGGAVRASKWEVWRCRYPPGGLYGHLLRRNIEYTHWAAYSLSTAVGSRYLRGEKCLSNARLHFSKNQCSNTEPHRANIEPSQQIEGGSAIWNHSAVTLCFPIVRARCRNGCLGVGRRCGLYNPCWGLLVPYMEVKSVLSFCQLAGG